MSILVGAETRLIVQGITGREGGFHAGQMLAYGTNVVAGVTPADPAPDRSARLVRQRSTVIASRG